MSEFDALIGPLLQREGGYVDHKADRGGATNYGITQRVYSDWSNTTGRDVRAMQKGEAVKIYFDLYWKPAKCDQLPEQIREIHFDSAVNHGVGRAVSCSRQYPFTEPYARLRPAADGAQPSGPRDRGAPA